MRKILSFAGTKTFWVLLGLIGVSLLIWFFGGIIAIGSYKPLENKLVRLAVIFIIFAIWILKKLYKRYMEARRNRVLVEEIKTSQEPILKHVKKDSPISQRFEEIDNVLKSARFSNSNSFLENKLFSGQYLYQMPWYVMIGAAGTGKTTVVQESGLNFPLESSFGASIGGLVGTRDCDWFLTDDAVILDTAGRLSLQDRNEEDSFDWQEFVSLLKRYRPKQPINGVIVAIGLDDILNPQSDFRTISTELRKRIHEMRSKFGINFPVYLVITKLDILNGFNEFFYDVTEEQRKSYLGFTLPNKESSEENIEDIIAIVSKELNAIQDTIESSYLKIINGLKEKDQKDALFTFSNEFEIVNTRLILLFRELYKSSKFEDQIQWRGMFFTSATQNGTSYNPVFDELKDSFELAPKYSNSETGFKGNPKGYFINNLFEDVIFKESNLADSNKIWTKKNQIIWWLSIGALASAAVLATGLIFNSYLNNYQYLEDVNDRAIKLNQEFENIPVTKDLLQAVLMAEKIRDIPKSEYLTDLDNPPMSMRMGLYQGSNMYEISNATYQRSLRERVMPLISYKLDELLRNSSDTPSIYNYNALKAYLMIYDDTKLDVDFMLDWLMTNFEKTSSIQNKQQQEKVREALKYIIEQKGMSPSLPLDTKLIEEKRQSIARNDLSVMILSDAFSEIAGANKKITPISFDTMGGKQSRLIFSRVSGKPITEIINPVFTKQAYIEFVLPELLKSTAKLYKEEDWVLGSYASLKSSETDTLKAAKEAYFQRYISTWNQYIADIQLKQPQNLREARDIAKILSDTSSSPLENLIKGISDNTTLNLQKQLDNSDNPEVGRIIDRLVTKAGFGSAKDKASRIQENYLNTLKFNTLVDEEFAEFHSLTDSKDSSTPVIDEVILSVKDLYEFLDVLNIAVDKGIELPSNDSLFNYRAEINRLPTPFRQMFDQFSIFVLNQSIDEMNERLSDQKIEEEKQRQKLSDEADLKEAERDEKQKLQQQEQEKAAEEASVEAKKKQQESISASLDSKLQSITKLCSSATASNYPFSIKSKSDISLSDFEKIFGTGGSYYSFMKLDPEIAAISEASSLNELMLKNPEMKMKFSAVNDVSTVNKMFFSNDDKLQANLKARVIYMDPKLDKLVLKYNGSTYGYSHGPIASYDLTWPATADKKASIYTYSSNKMVGKVEANGPWALFRLLEEGSSTPSNSNKRVVDYIFDGNRVTVEYSAIANNNPLNLTQLRGFRCP